MACKLTFFAILLCLVGILANPIQQDVESNFIEDDEDFIDLSHLDGRAFGDPDEEVGKMLQEALNDTTDLNPEELGSYFEGDILMPKIEGRSALADKSKRWPGGVVPYIIEGGFPSAQRSVIESAIAEYHAKTCIRFVPRTSQSDYVIFKGDNSGCWSSVGRTGGAQTINLQKSGCLSKKGTAMHEIAHALGIFHEQNRADRDNHVKIRFENIQNGLEANFEKASPGLTNNYGVPYDYGSVMHYSASAFSKNGQPTIVALSSSAFSASRMGQREGFSQNDIKRLNNMYCSS
ncbi:hatching enzyme 1.2-like [Culicoides brevitarsis]|uniref:hatching enzyme 1.2-like n=1 Tax=Culicoides brevitarsis TaxID=469753 RepID=UPI00307C4C44